MHSRVLLFGLFFICSCSPFVNEFIDDVSDAEIYEALVKNSFEVKTKPKIVTWNIRFGSARFPFYGDSCGDKVIAKKDDIKNNLENIAKEINSIDPDIILLQEVDIFSKRSGYTNQIQYLLDNTSMNYGCFGSIWQADFIPNYGLGRINMGNAILSKYKIFDAERISLQLRTDQSKLVQYFYLRRNILKVKIPDLNLYAINIHATAFATDDTKQKHIDKLIEVLADIDIDGSLFVAGGDLNSLPPSATVIDFCESDMCPGDNFHFEGSDPFHKEGSYFNNFNGEPDILQPLYSSYFSAVPFFAMNDREHLTHAPSTSNDLRNIKYDRKLDYLFTNANEGWVSDSTVTHQKLWNLSDHMPISGILNLSGN
ncbi:MAG: hypothetical protein CMG74_05665 [Candidatus Marinimicrobia bacterium]|nr:hypothetical protein [Candidatus Neomarinimicrobiota bacterium]